MPLAIRNPERFGLTEPSVTLTLRVEDGAEGVDALAHSSRCATFFRSGYRKLALGSADPQSFVVEGHR